MTCRAVSRTVVRRVHGKRRNVKVTGQHCTSKTVNGPVTFKTATTRRATLSRAGAVYATGREVQSGRWPQLLLTPVRRLIAGHYVLMVSWTDRREHPRTQRMTITLA